MRLQLVSNCDVYKSCVLPFPSTNSCPKHIYYTFPQVPLSPSTHSQQLPCLYTKIKSSTSPSSHPHYLKLNQISIFTSFKNPKTPHFTIYFFNKRIMTIAIRQTIAILLHHLNFLFSLLCSTCSSNRLAFDVDA